MAVTKIEKTDTIEEMLKCKKSVLFKHSSRCSISAMAKKEFDSFVSQSPKDTVFYFIDVIQYRQLSQEIARITGIQHQSLQIIIFSEGKQVWHESHMAITKKNIENACDNVI